MVVVLVLAVVVVRGVVTSRSSHSRRSIVAVVVMTLFVLLLDLRKQKNITPSPNRLKQQLGHTAMKRGWEGAQPHALSRSQHLGIIAYHSLSCSLSLPIDSRYRSLNLGIVGGS